MHLARVRDFQFSIYHFLIFRGVAKLAFTTCIERPPISYLLFSLEGELDALPLRVSNEGSLRPRVARAQESI